MLPIVNTAAATQSPMCSLRQAQIDTQIVVSFAGGVHIQFRQLDFFENTTGKVKESLPTDSEVPSFQLVAIFEDENRSRCRHFRLSSSRLFFPGC